MCRKGLHKEAKAGRRRGFPWFKIAVVILGVMAIRSYWHKQSHWSWLDFRSAAVHSRFADGRFPEVEDDDLWALRRARGKTGATSPSGNGIDLDVAEPQGPQVAVADPPVKVDVQIATSPAPQPAVRKQAAPAARPVVPANIARTLADAQVLAERAIRKARELYERASRDAAALRVLAGGKTEYIQAAVTPKAAAAPPVSVAPHAVPESVTQSAPVPAAPASPADAPAAEQVASVAPPAASAPELPAIPTPPQPPAQQKEPLRAASSVSASTTLPPKPRLVVVDRSAKPRPERVAQQQSLARADKQPEKSAAAGERSGDVYTEKILVERYNTHGECEDALAEELQARTKAYVDRYLGPGASNEFSVPPSFIHDHLARDLHFESVESSVGPMWNLSANLTIDGRARAQLKRMHRDALVENRLLTVASGVAGVLLLLGTVFGYLKLDTMTRGYYTGRLQFAAAAMMILTMAAMASAMWFGVRSNANSPPKTVQRPPALGAHQLAEPDTDIVGRVSRMMMIA